MRYSRRKHNEPQAINDIGLSVRGLPFCPSCGKEVDLAAKFCRNCGTNLSSAPISASMQVPPYAPVRVSSVRAKLLVVLWVIGLPGIVLTYVTTSEIYWAALFTVIAVTFASTELGYEDAKNINKAKGRKVLDPTLWSLVMFLLWEVANPWYVFSRRKSALAN
jgi:zinc-ribbon domain